MAREIAGTAAAREWRLSGARAFHERFVELYGAHFAKLHRVMDRLSGEPEVARDLVQEAFVRLYRRGSLPASPEAWLISVAMNLLRNERTTRSRRLRLLSAKRSLLQGEPVPTPEQHAGAAEDRRRVRAALDRLPERERGLLVLQAEGYAYRDIAAALRLNEASVGTLLSRARAAFRRSYEDLDAPR